MTETNGQVHDYDADLAPQEFRFRYKAKDWVLREASADAGRKWRNASAHGASLFMTEGSDERRVTMPDAVADCESVLVQACVFDAESGTQPSLSEVRNKWSDKIVRDLFNRTKAMSGLDESETAESIQKQIDALTRKLRKLGAGDPSGNAPSSGQVTSTSPTD